MPGRSISAIKEWVEAHQVLVCMVFAYAVLAVAYVLFFAVPRPVTLSFAAQQTCMPQLPLLRIQKKIPVPWRTVISSSVNF